MFLLILAWYTLLFMGYVCCVTIANDKYSGKLRVATVICILPVLLFALDYIF